MLATALTSRLGRRALAFGTGGLMATVALVVYALAGASVTINAVSPGQDGAVAGFDPSAEALSDIPGNVLPLYLQAGRSRGIDWAILAAIGSLETDHCRSSLPGVHSGHNSAGAAGCMQFLDGTWATYGTDGNHDGRKSPYDPADAIPAAADLLVASGAPGDYRRAIFAYNHADWYVNDVLAKASEYRGALANQPLGGQFPGALLVNTQGARAVLALADGPHPRIMLQQVHRNDLQTGQIDVRVTSLLVAAARRHTTIRVSSLKGDHSTFTTSGNVSNHASGRAVDIDMVDGLACNSHEQGRTGACWQLAREMAAIKGVLHPTELIYGIDPDGDSGPAFACLAAACGGDHSTHVHAGYRG